MENDRGGDGRLRREFGDRFEEREVLREYRACPFEPVVNDELLDRDPLALLVAMKELPRLRAQATRSQRPAEEVDEIVLAAKFAVADRAEPGGLLQRHDLANGVVLVLPELCAVEQFLAMLLTCFDQVRGAQQAADLV